MVKNSVAVYIDGINRTRKVVLPIKFSNLLDEQLDECTISLRNVKKKNFAPLTPVEIIVTNEIYWGKYNKTRVSRREKRVKYFLVADDAADESILGSGYYNHDLALIEITKFAELVPVDTITFTNAIGRNYTENAHIVQPAETKDEV